MANFDIDKKQLQDEVVLDDNQLVCVLTNSIKTATEKELLLQSIINQMDEEYEFNLRFFPTISEENLAISEMMKVRKSA